MHAFIFDPLWEELIDDELLQKLEQSGVSYTVIGKVAPLHECRELFEGNEDRILCLNPDYVEWKLSSDDYKDIPGLKSILTASTGFEWIDQSVANERNIPICNIKNFSTQAVAEWAVMIMLNLARQTPRLIKDGFPLDYDKDFMKYRGQQLWGKKVGIIGLGNIGNAIAERCKGLGMEVVYWSRSSENANYAKVSLVELMSTADVIFPTLAKNEETSKLLTDEHLASVKNSSILVDIAHTFFNETKIAKMLEDGLLFGYGFEAKPKEFNSFKGNVWAAPAYAWTTYDSMYNSEVLQVENIILATKNEFPNRVNI